MSAKIPNWDRLNTDQKLSVLHDTVMNIAGKLTAHETAIGDLYGLIKKLEEKK